MLASAAAEELGGQRGGGGSLVGNVPSPCLFYGCVSVFGILHGHREMSGPYTLFPNPAEDSLALSVTGSQSNFWKLSAIVFPTVSSYPFSLIPFWNLPAAASLKLPFLFIVLLGYILDNFGASSFP